MSIMNKRIRKCLRDEDQIDKKVAELLSQKADLEVARQQEEDKEILKTFRGMKLDKHEVPDVLEGLQTGEILLIRKDDFLDESEGSTDAPANESIGAGEHAPESEADYGGQTNE